MEAFTYAVINCVLSDAYDGVKVEDKYIQDKMEDYLVCNKTINYNYIYIHFNL
jgi:hypothetical protein